MPDTENELQSEQSDKISQFFRPWALGILSIFLEILYPADVSGIFSHLSYKRYNAILQNFNFMECLTKKNYILIGYCIITEINQMKIRMIFGFILALANLTNASVVYALDCAL